MNNNSASETLSVKETPLGTFAEQYSIFSKLYFKQQSNSGEQDGSFGNSFSSQNQFLGSMNREFVEPQASSTVSIV